jgi:hypothetical protein
MGMGLEMLEKGSKRRKVFKCGGSVFLCVFVCGIGGSCDIVERKLLDGCTLGSQA